MMIFQGSSSKNLVGAMNAFYKHGFQIQLWKKHSHVPKHSSSDFIFIDKHTNLSYIDYISIECGIFFLDNLVPAFDNDRRCIPLDLHNCVDHYRFYPNNEYRFSGYDLICYSHKETSIEHQDQLAKTENILIAGPMQIDSYCYIGNLKDYEVIDFCKSGIVYNYDNYLLPEWIYYGCKLYNEAASLDPITYTDKLVGEYNEYWSVH